MAMAAEGTSEVEELNKDKEFINKIKRYV